MDELKNYNELTQYLFDFPGLDGMRDRINDNISLNVPDNPISRLEFMVDLVRGHLDILQDELGDLKDKYGLEE